MSTARRAFFAQAALGASALAALPGALSASSPTEPTSARAARRRVRRLGQADREASQPTAWDTTWMQRVKGAHRAMFDAPLVEFGYPVLRAGVWVEQVQEVFKVPASDITSVIVIRHDAIPLLMDHEYWRTYDAGTVFKVQDEDGEPLRFNPVLTPPPGEQGGVPARLTLDQQIARGAIVLGCNLAFGDVIESIQTKDRVSVAEARAIALRHLVPGTIMQPSGIFANVAAQQVGCLFVEASL